MNRQVGWIRIAGMLAVGGIAVGLPLLLGNDPYYLSIATGITLFAVPALGAWLMMASGMLSFGQGAFASTGAYTLALLSGGQVQGVVRADIPIWVSLIIGGLASAGVAQVLVYPLLRATGVAFSILTFVGLLALDETILLFPKVTGGGGGIESITPPTDLTILGTTIGFSSAAGEYYVPAVMLLVFLVIIERLQSSGYIRVLRAISQQPDLAQAVGINVKRYQATTFVVAAFFTGLMGAYSATYLGVASPYVWDLYPSIYIVAYAIVGGGGYVLGPLVGTALVRGFSAAIASSSLATLSLEPIVIGLGLIIVVLVMPGGLVSLGPIVLRAVTSVIARALRQYRHPQP